jgi:hypothetical protein
VDTDLLRRIRAELDKASSARRRGREGLARVCARRAAGWSLADYYRERTGRAAPTSAMDLLRWFQSDADAPSDLKGAAQRLTIRVTRDHQLPHDEDPLDDARRLMNAYARKPDRRVD